MWQPLFRNPHNLRSFDRSDNNVTPGASFNILTGLSGYRIAIFALRLTFEADQVGSPPVALGTGTRFQFFSGSNFFGGDGEGGSPNDLKPSRKIYPVAPLLYPFAMAPWIICGSGSTFGIRVGDTDSVQGDWNASGIFCPIPDDNFYGVTNTSGTFTV